MFDIDFGKCEPIFKILLPILLLHKKILHVYTTRFHITYSMSLVKFENRKMLPNLYVECNNYMFN